MNRRYRWTPLFLMAVAGALAAAALSAVLLALMFCAEPSTAAIEQQRRGQPFSPTPSAIIYTEQEADEIAKDRVIWQMEETEEKIIEAAQEAKDGKG
jgi:hypothetical protein